MDDIDLAQQNEELFRRVALNAHLRRSRHNLVSDAESPAARELPATAGRAGGANCLDCGEPILPARLAANPDAVRCISCQTRAETRR